MTNYIEQGKGKKVRIKFLKPNLGHILELEPLSVRLTIRFRVTVVAINDGLEFEWNHRVHVADETVNRMLNEILKQNPGSKISFLDE